MQFQYLPLLVSFGFAVLVATIFVAAGTFLGPRRPSSVKEEAFECGNPPSGTAWHRFSVKFYLTAILFIVFDVEVVFMYPWAVLFRPLGMFGFVEMAIFMFVLALGLVYVWRKGALEWD
jgi:NADH-quinone oxidoreductase subunit A